MPGCPQGMGGQAPTLPLLGKQEGGGESRSAGKFTGRRARVSSSELQDLRITPGLSPCACLAWPWGAWASVSCD